jgi:hypothetical protein
MILGEKKEVDWTGNEFPAITMTPLPANVYSSIHPRVTFHAQY